MERSFDLKPSPLTGALALGCAAGAAPAFGAALGTLHWLVELASHFVVHAALALLLLAALCALLRRPRFALAAAALATLNAAMIAPLYLPAGAPDRPAVRVRLLLANLLWSNRERAAMRRLVRAKQPDLLVLLELNDDWIAGLEPELRAFPQRIELPRSDAFGIGVYSRGAPLAPIALENPGPPWIVAGVQHHGVAFSIAALHTVPPISARAAGTRDVQLRALARQRTRLGPRALIAGDLNSSSWSPIFRELTAGAELRDSRRGFGVQGTWSPPLLPLRVPIDHVLVSAGIHVARREVGPDVGSDHRPVFVELELER